jgi:hypothetical protein
MPTYRLFICFAGLAPLAAIHAQPPTAYTVTQSGSMAGPAVETTIYRSGAKALVDTATTPTGGARPSHHRTLYDLQAHTSVTWNLADSAEACGAATFSGDWGDPFSVSAQITSEIMSKGAKETGAETVNGFATKLFEASIPEGKAKVWMEPKSGLAIKAQLIPATGAPLTLIETKGYIPGAPAPGIFAIPAACKAAAAAVPPPAPAEKERIAALTGGSPDDFVNATSPPASQDSCSVLFRVVRAGTMQPVTSGLQLAIDPSVDMEHLPHYEFGVGAQWKFSGGGLRDVTSQLRNGVLRLDNPKPNFYMDAAFGQSGDSSAFVYKHCFGPQTVLLFVVKNPAKLSDGGEWLYVKSGKYASADAR